MAKLKAAFPNASLEVQSLLELHDGEDDGGSALGGWRLLPVQVALAECVEMNDVAKQLGDDVESVWWSPEWIPLAFNGGDAYCIVDARSGQVSFRTDHQVAPLADSLPDFLERYLAELNAGVWAWNDEFQQVLHREQDHWIGTFPLDVPTDVLGLLRFLSEEIDRPPSDSELESLGRFTVSERLDAAERLMGEQKRGIRGVTLGVVARSVGLAGARWFQGLDGDFEVGSFVRAAALALPEEEAFEMALSLKPVDPLAYAPVAGERLLDWIEAEPPTPMSVWGTLVSLCSPKWTRLNDWLNRGRPLSLIALDAMQQSLAPDDAPWQLSQETHIVDLPVAAALKAVADYGARDNVPRTQRAVAVITASLREH